MGGEGSGRRGQRELVSKCACHDVNEWKRLGLIAPGCDAASFSGVTHQIVWSDCNYGNQRPWFVCPGCDRRVGKLYQRRSALDSRYRCRQCLNLTYESSNASGNFYRQNKLAMADIRKRLKDLRWCPGEPFNPPPRPDWMHYKTYDRLLDDYVEAEKRFWDKVIESSKPVTIIVHEDGTEETVLGELPEGWNDG